MAAQDRCLAATLIRLAARRSHGVRRPGRGGVAVPARVDDEAGPEHRQNDDDNDGGSPDKEMGDRAHRE